MMNDYKLESAKRHTRSLSMLCEDESLSDTQLKAYQTRFQEYRTFLEAVTRLASCGNVCITEETVMVGENGMLNGESLNALQHAGAISVYNALQQNNWEFPVPEEGDVAVIRDAPERSDELLDSENPVRADWPAIHVSDCFIDGEKAKLHGSVRPLRTFLPPTVTFRNAADMEEDVGEQDPATSNPMAITDDIEIINSQNGLAVKRTRKEKDREVEILSIEDYFYGRQDPAPDYAEDKADYKFKCAVCQRMFTSNVKLMHHILEHVDDACPALMCLSDSFFCQDCQQPFESAYDFRLHQRKIHGIIKEPNSLYQRHEEDEQMDESQMPLAKPEYDFECKICGKECQTELSLAHHLQFTHRYKEMPYVCRLCFFRSSIYEDIVEHFFRDHSNTNHLLCVYCLRIFTPIDARPAGQSPPSQSSLTGAVTTVGLGAGVGQTQVYLQHLRMHQVLHHVRNCGCCKLNFTNKSDFQIHRRLDHRSTLANAIPYPNELRPKVSIPSNKNTQSKDHKMSSLSSGQIKSEDANISNNANLVLINGQLMQVVQEPMEQMGDVIVDANEQMITSQMTGITYKESPRQSMEINQSPEKSIVSPVKSIEGARVLSSPKISRLKAATMYKSQDATMQMKTEEGSKKPSSAPRSISLNAPEATRTKDLSSVNCNRVINKKYPCLECEKFLMDGNHRRYLPCSACRFATCCAASFNRHVQSMHMKDSSKLSTAEHQKGMPFLKPMKFSWTKLVGKKGQNENDSGLEINDPRNVNNYPANKFHCKRCGFNTTDGNSLACHLVEECGSETVTLNPSDQLLKNYQKILEKKELEARIAEENYRLAEEEKIQSAISHETQIVAEASEVPTAHVSTPHSTPMASVPDQSVQMVAEEHTTTSGQQLPPGSMAVQTLGVLMPNQAVELTDAQGQVFQTLTWPEDLVLEEDQIVVVMQGEDGQVQLAVVSQQSYDPITQQVIISTEETSANAQTSEQVYDMTGEEEKENMHQSEMIEFSEQNITE